jgi:CubicO group peptidase (beta-lactamase class C family)
MDTPRRTRCAALAVLFTSATVLAQWARAADVHTGPGMDWVEYHNATADEHKTHKDALKAGYRLISLSLAGSAASPRYAAVWVKATSPDQHFSDIVNTAGNPCCTEVSINTKISNELMLGYCPVLITAVGDTEASAKYAAVFEPLPVGITSCDISGANSASNFATLNANKRGGGLLLQWAAVFGTVKNPVYYGLYFRPTIPGSTDKANTGRLRWADSTGDTDAFNDEFNAYAKEWVRPAVLALAPDGSYFAGWYDSLLKADTTTGPQAYAYPDVDATYLDLLITAAQDAGLLPMQVQAIERDGSLHYSVVFGDEASILKDPDRRLVGLPRTFDSNGSPDLTLDPTLQPFQTNMKDFMLKHGVRAATLAVAKDGRLVFARAYTWAEVQGGYPTTTPFDRFRIGSVSKLFTMVLACKLEENGVLYLADQLINDLASPPMPGDPDFVRITLRDLIAHRSGLPRSADDPPDISQKLNGKIILPVTRDEQTQYEVEYVNVKPAPGQKFRYSNLGYYFAGVAAAHRAGEGYDNAVRDVVFPKLFVGANHPEVTKSTFEDQSPDEVRYHTNSLKLVESVVDTAQPWVPLQYGGNDYNLKAPSGGWSATAAQLAKIMALLTLPSGLVNPLLDGPHLKGSDHNGMLDFLNVGGSLDFTKTMGGLIISTSVTDPTCNIPAGVTSYEKNGGVPGVKAWAITRTDGVTMAVVVTGDTGVTSCELQKWAAKVDWSKVPATTDYFMTYNVHPY